MPKKKNKERMKRGKEGGMKKKKFSELTFFPSFSQMFKNVSPAHAPGWLTPVSV